MNPAPPTAEAVQRARDLAEEMVRIAARCDLRPQDCTWVNEKTAYLLDLAAHGNPVWIMASGYFRQDCERVVRECGPLQQGLDVLRNRRALQAFAWALDEALHGRGASLPSAEDASP